MATCNGLVPTAHKMFNRPDPQSHRIIRKYLITPHDFLTDIKHSQKYLFRYGITTTRLVDLRNTQQDPENDPHLPQASWFYRGPLHFPDDEPKRTHTPIFTL